MVNSYLPDMEKGHEGTEIKSKSVEQIESVRGRMPWDEIGRWWDNLDRESQRHFAHLITGQLDKEEDSEKGPKRINVSHRPDAHLLIAYAWAADQKGILQRTFGKVYNERFAVVDEEILSLAAKLPTANEFLGYIVEMEEEKSQDKQKAKIKLINALLTMKYLSTLLPERIPFPASCNNLLINMNTARVSPVKDETLLQEVRGFLKNLGKIVKSAGAKIKIPQKGISGDRVVFLCLCEELEDEIPDEVELMRASAEALIALELSITSPRFEKAEKVVPKWERDPSLKWWKVHRSVPAAIAHGVRSAIHATKKTAERTGGRFRRTEKDRFLDRRRSTLSIFNEIPLLKGLSTNSPEKDIEKRLPHDLPPQKIAAMIWYLRKVALADVVPVDQPYLGEFIKTIEHILIKRFGKTIAQGETENALGRAARALIEIRKYLRHAEHNLAEIKEHITHIEPVVQQHHAQKDNGADHGKEKKGPGIINTTAKVGGVLEVLDHVNIFKPRKGRK